MAAVSDVIIGQAKREYIVSVASQKDGRNTKESARTTQTVERINEVKLIDSWVTSSPWSFQL